MRVKYTKIIINIISDDFILFDNEIELKVLSFQH